MLTTIIHDFLKNLRTMQHWSKLPGGLGLPLLVNKETLMGRVINHSWNLNKGAQ